MPPSIRQLQGKVQNTEKDVLQSWRKLQEVVEKNEGTRQRIWNNKTRLVRENILRSA
jgi:predicted Holliday junction resolvase-like endonuclease